MATSTAVKQIRQNTLNTPRHPRLPVRRRGGIGGIGCIELDGGHAVHVITPATVFEQRYRATFGTSHLEATHRQSALP